MLTSVNLHEIDHGYIKPHAPILCPFFLGLQGIVGVVVDHEGNALVCIVDNHLQII